MRTRWLNLWDDVLDEFWLWPTLMTFGAAALFFITLTIDRRVAAENVWWQFDGGADGARALLSTVAGSVITVAGTVFSITIAALTLASAQFGPRLLRNFTHDTGNQLALGTFVGTFTYCILVLRTVRSVEEKVFVPHLSVWLGVSFGFASLLVLIYFIHHVSSGIQAPKIAATVGRDLEESVHSIFPSQFGKAAANAKLPDFAGAATVTAPQSGYIQAIAPHQFLASLARHDVAVHLEHRPGDWVVRGETLLRVFPAPANEKALARELHDCIIIGDRRTRTQDIEFLLNQLVEMAMRALSPAINDPFTAIACLDWLGSSLCLIARHGIPSPLRADEEGKLRIVADPVTFDGLCDAAFHLIRQYGNGSAAVLIHLMETFTRIAHAATAQEHRAALCRHAEMCERAKTSLGEPNDRADLEHAYAAFLKAKGS
jgi:uncharacterized membrane protein